MFVWLKIDVFRWLRWVLFYLQGHLFFHKAIYEPDVLQKSGFSGPWPIF